LNPADLMIVCTHGKSWNRAGGAELLQVVSFAIKYHPGDAGCHRCVRNLGECGSTGGFHKDAVHAGVASLNYVQKLLALMNWVISGKKRLQVHSQADRGFLRRRGLLALIVVIVGNQRDNETESLHVLASTGEISCYS
jgi:hypothetical protein